MPLRGSLGPSCSLLLAHFGPDGFGNARWASEPRQGVEFVPDGPSLLDVSAPRSVPAQTFFKACTLGRGEVAVDVRLDALVHPGVRRPGFKRKRIG